MRHCKTSRPAIVNTFLISFFRVTKCAGYFNGDTAQTSECWFAAQGLPRSSWPVVRETSTMTMHRWCWRRWRPRNEVQCQISCQCLQIAHNWPHLWSEYRQAGYLCIKSFIMFLAFFRYYTEVTLIQWPHNTTERKSPEFVINHIDSKWQLEMDLDISAFKERFALDKTTCERGAISYVILT